MLDRFKIVDVRHLATRFDCNEFQVRAAGIGDAEAAELARQKQLEIANRKRKRQGKEKPLDGNVLKIVRG